jgi:hypothetical protein
MITRYEQVDASVRFVLQDNKTENKEATWMLQPLGTGHGFNSQFSQA